MLQHLRTGVSLLLVLTVITGIAYPAAVTAIAQTCFPSQANGSLITQGNTVIGSTLIGQSFDDPSYFWSRPSATAPTPYNAAASSGSNLGPLNPSLLEAVTARCQALHAADPGNAQPIPVDLVTASASGLDPHISPAAALYQAPRIARLRSINLDMLHTLISQHTESRWLGLLGEPRVNVLALNLALDRTAHSTDHGD